MAIDFTLAEGTTIGPLEFYKRFRTELHHFFCVNARNPSSADDLLQDMYLALREGTTPDELHDGKAYLFRVAWNLLKTANRRAQRERRKLLWIAARRISNQPAAEVEDDSSTTLAAARWEAVLAQLPPLWQVVVLRHFRDGLTYQQIADELHCSRSAVKKYATRAQEMFRLHFSNIEVAEERLRRRSGRGERS